jgi:hypothetical protein
MVPLCNISRTRVPHSPLSLETDTYFVAKIQPVAHFLYTCYVYRIANIATMSHQTDPAKLIVRRALETDIDRLMEVQFSAFENDPYHEALFPGPHHSPAVRKVAGQRTLDDWRNTAVQDIMVCTNAQTGEVLGFAAWYFYLHERPREEWEKMPSTTWAEGEEKKQAEAFLGATARMRMKIWEGRPHICKFRTDCRFK